MGDDTEYVTDTDLGAPETLVTAHAHPSNAGHPAFVEPEPRMIKSRFGRMKEERVDFPLPTGRWRCYSPTVHNPHNG